MIRLFCSDFDIFVFHLNLTICTKQISLIQRYGVDIVMEFSFLKHSCKPCLLADIADTEYATDTDNNDNVISDILQYAVSKQQVSFSNQLFFFVNVNFLLLILSFKNEI